MTDKVLKYMEEYHMLPENGNMVVGVSGGADSVCLLLVLLRLRKRFGLRLRAVHVNHGLRREAGEDARFVESLCERWQVPFLLVEEDVKEIAGREHISDEEAGRLVRYRAFERALAEADGNGPAERGCIAVAHNSDDRAETLLFHLLRGTGLSGMGSIRPVRENQDGSRVIRPLLCCSRREIEDFLEKEGVAFRTDATNTENVYTRNKIRNRLLPFAEQEICTGAKAHLAREAALLADTADFVERRTEDALCRCSGGGDIREEAARGRLCVDADAFCRTEPFLQDQMIWFAVRRLGKARDMTAAHVAELKKLFLPACVSGRQIVLPLLRLCARREFGTVILERMPEHMATDAGQLWKGRKEECGKLRNIAAERARETGPGGKRMHVFVVRGRMEDRELEKERNGAAHDILVPGLGRVEAKLMPGPGAFGAVRPERGNDSERVTEDCPGNMNKTDFTLFFENIPEKKYTKWLNYDNIIESAVFRTRCSGDYLTINDALDRKSLKRYMIEERIPAAGRDTIMLLADGQHIIWVPGHRISAAYKVTERTKTVLFLRCTGTEPADFTAEEES